MGFDKIRTAIAIFCFTFGLAGLAMAATPASEIESYLKKESKHFGSFIKTAANPEDDSDNFVIYGATCEWSVEKKSFTFTLFENIKNSEVGKFIFSFVDGFSYVDSKTNQITKSGVLTNFYKTFWSDGQLNLAKAFSIKKSVVMDRGNIHHNAYTLTPKGTFPSLALKPVEVDFDKDIRKLQYLKFQIEKSAYIWSTDEASNE